MRRRFRVVAVLLGLLVSTTRPQQAISSKDRIADLEQLAGFYAKNYAPYKWKRDVVGFDLLRLIQGPFRVVIESAQLPTSN